MQPVGRLAIRNGFIYFQYDKEFLQGNLEISSLKLPLQCGVIELQTDPFEGLAGIFNQTFK
ncbi:HipA N-terminal domain-containing protein [Elizabethkingia anophelis]|nr:HipA N-terminal domain-containing protein [Elizabethkingia anophelis]